MANETTTLSPGGYALPNDCTAFVRAGWVVVSRKVRAKDETPRCRNCKHFQPGRHSYNQSYATYVCLRKPKTNGNTGYRADIKLQQRYFAATGSHKACDNYEPKGGDR